MLYLFLVPLAKDHILFNVFRYLTFRSFMALITAVVISLVVGPWLIQKLRVMQHGGETIREDTPERHRGKKGTPTMGGVLIVGAVLATTLLWANLQNRYVLVAMLRSEEHTSELQSRENLVCRLLLEKKKRTILFGAFEHRGDLRERTFEPGDRVADELPRPTARRAA